MISKNFYFQLIIRIVFITVTAVFMAFSWVNHPVYFPVALFILLIIQVVFLIKYLNKTNRRIAYFFESVKNEDYTLQFSEDTSFSSLNELNKNMNKVNHLIKDTQIKNRVQEKYYQEILKQANVGIMTFNDKGHILFSNQTVKKIFNLEQLNHIKRLEMIDKELYQLLKTLKPFERKFFQFANERENVQLILKSSTIILDKDPLMLVVVQDIKNELDEKETDSWIRLIRVLTHEIMNTITPITSISQSILKYYDEKSMVIDEKHNQNTLKGLTVIQEQSQNLMDFVRSYRTFLSIPKPDKEIIALRVLFEKIKTLMSEELSKNDVDLKLELIPDTLEVFADEKQISQVLLNLIKNAIQALSVQETKIIKLKGGVNAKGEKYIEVYDNGPGIPQDIMDQIFIPFFTTKNNGTGIGLSLSKQVMQLHGGSLKVKSTPGQETSFSLIF
ncbi:histidine kinase [Flavobacteriaceae bacterium R38]|nr:histidine kinase [Flavobacteriaceae bacterium R38]